MTVYSEPDVSDRGHRTQGLRLLQNICSNVKTIRLTFTVTEQKHDGEFTTAGLQSILDHLLGAGLS